MPQISIAVDGPASSGKGTVARRVAASLGYDHVDTGAMYRAVAWACGERGVDWGDAAGAAAVAASLEFAFPLVDGAVRVRVDGSDVSAIIRGEQIGSGASRVAAIPGVRAALLSAQRELGRRGGVVMDGRDIGTVVLPEAQLKLYLDASLEERARRRQREFPARGYADIYEELRLRDDRDMNRAVAPLRAAADAIHIDSTRYPIDAVVEQVLARARERGAG